MCFTGNFALTMMLEPAMLAPVLSQPSLPLDDPGRASRSRPTNSRRCAQRLERDDLTVLAYRFEGDQFCMAQRFAAYAEALGDRFVGRVLPDSAANSDLPPFFERYVTTPHSVVTAHLIDEAGQPTIAARDEILAFFTQRLAPESRERDLQLTWRVRPLQNGARKAALSILLTLDCGNGSLRRSTLRGHL